MIKRIVLFVIMWWIVMGISKGFGFYDINHMAFYSMVVFILGGITFGIYVKIDD